MVDEIANSRIYIVLTSSETMSGKIGRYSLVHLLMPRVLILNALNVTLMKIAVLVNVMMKGVTVMLNIQAIFAS